jgi:dCMP deaminase
VTDRPSMDNVLLHVATIMALRGTCQRLRVGAVLAVDGRICATGFNGSPHGLPHCAHDADEVAATGSRCVTSVHAEANAVAFAARHGVSIQRATLYCTDTPCVHCAMLLVNAGITRVVCRRWYHDGTGVDVLRSAGIELWTATDDGGFEVPT